MLKKTTKKRKAIPRRRFARAKESWQQRTRDPKFDARFQAALAYWTEQARPLIEACRNAERLTAADYNIRITI